MGFDDILGPGSSPYFRVASSLSKVPINALRTLERPIFFLALVPKPATRSVEVRLSRKWMDSEPRAIVYEAICREL